jgi:hypothetical protein
VKTRFPKCAFKTRLAPLHRGAGGAGGGGEDLLASVRTNRYAKSPAGAGRSSPAGGGRSSAGSGAGAERISRAGSGVLATGLGLERGESGAYDTLAVVGGAVQAESSRDP